MKNNDWSPKRWLRITLPAVLIVVWLIAAGLGGPTFGKISDVSTNDQASFLPASAESTVARDWQLKFVDSNVIPAVVLLTSEETLTQEQFGKIAGLSKKLAEVSGVQEPEAPATTSIAGPIPSDDNKAVEFLVPDRCNR